jgi:hypothetical protein
MKKRIIALFCALGILSTLLASCASSVPESGAITAAEVQATTAVPLPTATKEPMPTATPSGLDLEMLHNFPTSYDYVVTHPEEYVRAPDPITERAEFDQWFMEKLVPALGPVADRPLNLTTYDAGDSITGFDVSVKFGTQIPFEGQLTFFYFVDAGTVYPVACINIDISINPGVTWFTYCPILMVGPMGQGTFMSQLDNLTLDDMFFKEMYIYTDLSQRPDVHWEESVVNMVNSIGVYDDGGSSIRFGPGLIVMCSRTAKRCQ